MMIYWRDFSANDTVSVSWLCTLFFTTKYRRKLFDSQMIAQLREAFGSAAAKLECEIIEMDGGARPCTPAGCLPAKTGGQCDGQ